MFCGESQEHSHSSGTNRLEMGIVVKGFFSALPWGNGLSDTHNNNMGLGSIVSTQWNKESKTHVAVACGMSVAAVQ